MFTTAEKLKKYNIGGVSLSKRVWMDIGNILFVERCQRQMTLDKVCKETELAWWRVEKIEQGQQRLNWSVLAVLLDFYGKKLEIRLVDEEQE